MYIRKALFTTKLALFLILGYVVVRAVLLPDNIENTLAPASVMGQNRPIPVETTYSQNLSLADYAQIAKKNPFAVAGQIENSSGQILNTDSFDQQSSVSQELGLALLGTISGSQEVARAIIKDIKTGISDLYKTGQTVGDALIESIGSNIVTLRLDGEAKILRLNTKFFGDNKNYNARTYLSQTIRQTTNIDSSPQNMNNVIQTKLGFMTSLLKKAIIKPYKVNGQIEGLQITGLENIKNVKYIGIKNGDIIRQINGQRLTSKQKAFQIFKKAKSQSAVNIELMRGSKIKKLSFKLQ